MKRRGTLEITQQEVAAALARFLKQGGMIQQLPAQAIRSGGLVGGDKYQAYESLNDLPALAGTPDQAA